MNLEQARQIAQNENTASELLAELANSEDCQVRKAVAANPNTPVKVLKKLGSEFPEEITNNPIFSLLLLEKPNSKFIRLSLARSSTTEAETLERLAELEEEDILCAIACNYSTPVHLLEQLASREQTYTEYGERLITKVPACIAANPHTPPRILDKLANHNDSYVRQVVAENKNTLPTTLEKLAYKNNKHILLKVAQNINTPVSTLERLAGEKDREIRDTVIAHFCVSNMAMKIVEFMEEKPGTPKNILEKLATDDRLHIKQMVADHPLCPPQILKQLAEHNDYTIASCVSIHPNTQAEVLEKLSLKLVSSVKQNQRILKAEKGNANYEITYINLFNHPHNTLYAQLQLITLDYYESLKKVAKYKNISAQILDKLSQRVLKKLDEDSNNRTFREILISILHNCNTSAKTISNIFNKINSNIKYNILRYFQAIALNHNTPSHIIEKIYDSEHHKHLKTYIAQHPNTSENLLRKLYSASNFNFDLGYSLVSNANTPCDILLDIIPKYDWGIKRDLAQFNHRIPDNILQTLIDDEQVEVKAALATNSCLPISIIERFACSEIDVIREGVSKNPKAPAYILDILANESDVNIRLNVAKHQSTSEKTLLKLAEDREESIKVELSLRNPINLNVIKVLIYDIENNFIADKINRFIIMNQVAKDLRTPDFLLEIISSCILSDTVFHYSGKLEQVEQALTLNQNTPVDVLENIIRNKRNYTSYQSVKKWALRNLKTKTID